MPKKTKTLSGASQDAYFRRVLSAHPSLPAEERDKLVQRLRRDIAQLRVRPPSACSPESQQSPSDAQTPLPAASPAPAFDPFTPNVIVLVRKAGSAAAVAALGSIEDVAQLRLLAREQRLAVSADITSPADLRAAIVAAAERRIVNRNAAAS